MRVKLADDKRADSEAVSRIEAVMMRISLAIVYDAYKPELKGAVHDTEWHLKRVLRVLGDSRPGFQKVPITPKLPAWLSPCPHI